MRRALFVGLMISFGLSVWAFATLDHGLSDEPTTAITSDRIGILALKIGPNGAARHCATMLHPTLISPLIGHRENSMSKVNGNRRPPKV